MGLGNYMQKPLWDPSNFTYSGIGFNNFLNNNTFCNFNTPIWQTSSTSSSKTNSDNESYEDWKKRTRNEQEQKAVNNEFLEEQQKEINKTKDLIDAQSKMISAVKKGKKSDGRTVVESAKIEGVKLKEDGTIDKEAMKPKKKGFWGKCGEWLSSAGSALANMGKAFIGMDENGKINPKKAITNLAITAAAVGACFIPVVGPAIGYGLLAYGVGSGAVGVYKGVKKLNNARTEEEREQARQDVCSGTIVGVASAFGLRSLGKSMGTAANASSTATNTVGKVSRGITNFGKDITVNAVKATGKAMQADKALIASNGGSTSGFFKAWGNKISSAWEGFNSWQKRYDTQYTNMETNLNNRLSIIDSQIQEIRALGSGRGLTPIESQRLALLKEEQLLVRQNITELQTNFSTTQNKTIYDKLVKNNSTSKAAKRIANRNASANPNKIQGKNIPETEVKAFNNRILNEQKAYAKELKKLLKLKENTMRTYAKHPDDYSTELSQYVPSPNVSRSRWKPSTWRKNDYQLAIGGKNPGKWGEIAGLTLTSPAAPAYLSAAQWTRDYSVPMFGNLVEMTPEQTEAYLKQLEQEKSDLEKALENIRNVKDANEWNQLKAQAQAQREAAEKDAQED